MYKINWYAKKWLYGQWDHFMVSTSKLIYLEKRYQQNPQGGVPTFQVTLCLIYFSAKQRICEYFYYFNITNIYIIPI